MRKKICLEKIVSKKSASKKLCGFLFRFFFDFFFELLRHNFFDFCPHIFLRFFVVFFSTQFFSTQFFFFLFDTFFILTIQSFFQVILINPSLIMVLHNYQYIFRDVYNVVLVILKNITNYIFSNMYYELMNLKKIL